ncbi:6350_t:CDS:2, partial [Dentiscutata erythropus]
APEQAFEVDVDKVTSKREIKPTNKIDKLEECKTELDTLCKKNFISYGGINALSPWLSVFFGVSYQESKITEAKTTDTNITISSIVKNGENYENWEIGEYDGIKPTFEFLDFELQKKIKEILGYKILKANVEEIKHEIPDGHECHIFASIMNKEDENVFSLCVDYEDRYSPVILVHLFASKKEKNKRYSTQIGWIVVGYPRNFDFDQAEYPIILRGYSPKISKLKNQYIASIPDTNAIPHYLKTRMLSTCVLEAPSRKTSYNPYNTTIAIGTHFTSTNHLACLFACDISKNNKLVTDDSIINLFCGE